MLQEGESLWKASQSRIIDTNLNTYLKWLEDRGYRFSSYQELWSWSTTDLEAFWRSIWDYFEIVAEGEIGEVLTSDPMPRTRWFTGTRVNYAEHVLRYEYAGDPARTVLHHASELRTLKTMSWAELAGSVRKLATRLRAMGITAGDRIVAYMPNIPETVIAMLATTAIGAVWSSAAPEFGAQTVIDRFGQIAPKLVFAVNGYRYGGKDFDRTGDLTQILGTLPTAEHLIMLDYQPEATKSPDFRGATIAWEDILGGPEIPADQFAYERVFSDHPLWILFSSGTTGLPKPIVHGHHGIVVEHYKSAAFHFELAPDGALFFYSTTGWMVWNTLMWGPLMNATAVLYDGHPAFPNTELLWRIASKSRASVLGVNPTFLQIVRQQGFIPREHYDFQCLQSIMLVGSPATPEVFGWIYEAIGNDVWATSQSGGTEFCSGLLAGTPMLPTLAGEIQAPALGTDACAFDQDGKVLIDQIGELVIRRPMPSMPLFFWGDDNFERYTSSYFEAFPGVWTHGDRVKFNAHGGCHVLGRSDATLNRFGIRIGSAEIYRTVDTFQEIADSLIVCIEEGNGGYYMPLFVELAAGIELTEDLTKAICSRLRSERSPRHVPDEIVAAPAIPITLTGKKMEVPIRKLLLGDPLEKVASTGATRNPAALEWFANFAKKRQVGMKSKS